jgi:protease IV
MNDQELAMDNAPGAPTSVPTARVPPPLPSPPRRSWLGVFAALFFLGMPFALLLVLLLWALGGSLSSGTTLEEKFHSLTRGADNKIAIIRVEGTILDGEGYVKQQIDAVRKDPTVKAVVLRVDSPGGTVTGSDYIYHHLTKLRREKPKDDSEAAAKKGAAAPTGPSELPLVVSMGGMAASGGYYVAMAVGEQPDAIFAEPTTWTGSIGVVIPHYNVAGLMERFDVQEDSIKSHPLKQMGAPTRKMTVEERDIFQGLVDDSFARFKEIVRSGRPKFKTDPAALDALATGQVFTTRQAIESGLVDREGFLEEAIDRTLELAGLDKEKTQVVEYERPIGLFDVVLASQAAPPSQAAGIDLAALLDLTAPRAYYMCTWLPTIAQNRGR